MDLANFRIFAVVPSIPCVKGNVDWPQCPWRMENSLLKQIGEPRRFLVSQSKWTQWIYPKSTGCKNDIPCADWSFSMTVPLRLMHRFRWVVTPRVLARPQGFAEVQTALGAKVLYRSVLSMSAQAEHLETAEGSGVTCLTRALSLVFFWPSKPCKVLVERYNKVQTTNAMHLFFSSDGLVCGRSFSLERLVPSPAWPGSMVHEWQFSRPRERPASSDLHWPNTIEAHVIWLLTSLDFLSVSVGI